MADAVNVLMIMTDQHRADCLGCMGNDIIQTPHIDRLASEGAVFENAFCQSPVCMASRASLFTGRYPEAVGVRGMGILPPSETTLPEWLWRQGMETAAFGKLHFTPERYTQQNLGSDVPILDWRAFAEDAKLSPIPDDSFKHNYGFQTHCGCDDACQGEHRAWLQKHSPHLLETGKRATFPDGPGELFVSPYPSECHPTTFIALNAVSHIRQAREKPWFTLCSFIAPHHPFEAPAEQIARYPLDKIPLPQAKGGVDIAEMPNRMQEAISEIDRYSEEIQRRIVQHYYASISLIDDNVGRLLDALQETGQMDNTIIVFTADHGEMLGNHGLLRKPSFHYDETLRVPLILKAPGVPAQRLSGLVELVDLYPTLLGMLGLPVNAGVQGTDWSTHLQQGRTVGHDAIFSGMHDLDPMVFEEGWGPFTACLTLRTSEWKLNVYPGDSLACSQLFHLAEDPDETTNLFHVEAHRKQREQMLWNLLQRQHKNQNPLPLRLRQW